MGKIRGLVLFTSCAGSPSRRAYHRRRRRDAVRFGHLPRESRNGWACKVLTTSQEDNPGPRPHAINMINGIIPMPGRAMSLPIHGCVAVSPRGGVGVEGSMVKSR